jgi:hypothetical protein
LTIKRYPGPVPAERNKLLRLSPFWRAGLNPNRLWAEEFFSRMRRAEIGHHHHIAGQYLLRYAQEASWREDNRRVDNGAQVSRVAELAMKRKPSVDFSGYWQRHKDAAA